MGLRALGNPLASFIDYLAQTGTDASNEVPPPGGLTATGGVISDYVDGSDVYRAHIFTSSGTFDVTAPGNYGDTIEYLVVAGGGAGGPPSFLPPFLQFQQLVVMGLVVIQ